MDTSTSTGKLLLGALASVAEFETHIHKERQREGIDSAKADGVYKGRKPSVDAASVDSSSIFARCQMLGTLAGLAGSIRTARSAICFESMNAPELPARTRLLLAGASQPSPNNACVPTRTAM